MKNGYQGFHRNDSYGSSTTITVTAANVVGSAVSDSNTGMTREKREEVAAMVSDDNHVVFSFSSSICISLPYMYLIRFLPVSLSNGRL